MTRWALLVLIGGSLGCEGVVGDGGDRPGPGPGPAPGPMLSCDDPGPDAAPTPLRRLTREEYDNAIRDLLGDTSAPAQDFPADDDVGGFRNNLTAVGELQVEQYLTTSETLASSAVTRLDDLLPCDPRAIGLTPCAEEFIDSFGLRAYRRPLTTEERDAYVGLYQLGEADGGLANGIRLVVAAMLQSPQFLYHVEHGGVPDESGLSQLPPYELASRLSFFLWSSIPDDELLAAAAAGELDEPADVEAQARRMLNDPKAAVAIGSFHAQWTGVADLPFVNKDRSAYPSWDPTLVATMQGEVYRFSDYVVRAGDGSLDTLLTAEFSFADGGLFDLYGVADPGAGALGHDGYRQIETGAGRSGLLTLSGVMAVHSHPVSTSPTFRGKFVRERLLCTSLPEPPNNVDITLPDIGPDATAKERLELHRTDPTCAGCHEYMDPIGFAFEHFDAIGAYRTMDGTAPVDATGELLHTEDSDGSFDGAVELGQRLADSEQVRQCVVTQWFRFALARGDAPEDDCSRVDAYERFVESDYDIRELMIGLTQTDAFLLHRIEE